MTDEELNRKFDVVAEHLASLAISQQRAGERTSRLERTLLLAIRAGRRERREWRERHAALVDGQAALIDAQVRTEDTVAHLAQAQVRTEEGLTHLAQAQGRTEAAVAKLAQGQAHTDAALAEVARAQVRTDAALAELAQAQAHTDGRLDALIDIVREGRTGKGE